MPALLHRSLLLALLLTVLVGALVLPVPAAAESQVTLTLEAGFEGKAKAGQWVPVTATMVNEGAEWSGLLEFTTRVEVGPNRQASSYQYPVVVPAGATKRLLFYLPLDQTGAPLVRLRAGEQVVVEVQPKLEATFAALVGVLGVEPADLVGLAGTQVGERSLRLIRLTSETVPAEPLALRSLDALLLDRFTWAELPVPQQEAVQTWIEHGGTLILAGGPEVERLAPLFDWLEIDEAARMSQSVPGVGTADLIRLHAQDWRPAYQLADVVLAWSRDLGAGEVHFLAFDPALEPFASWSGLPDLLSHTAATAWRSEFVLRGPIGSLADQASVFVADQLRQMPVRAVPFTRRLLLILGVYAVVIGPVHLLLLRGLRRLGWALLTLPLLALAGAGTAYGYMQANRAADVSVISLGVVEGHPDGGSLMVRSLTGFYQPPGSSHTARIGGALLSATPSIPIVTPGMPFKPTDGESLIDQGRTVRLGPVDGWEMRTVAAQGTREVPGTVAGALTIDGQYVSGRLTNQLPFPLKDVAVVAGLNFQRLGDLAPGQSVDLAVVVPVSAGQVGMGANRVGEAMNRLLDPGIIGPSGPTVEQRERMRRQGLSWALSGLLPWAQSPEQPKVLLIGWLETAGLPVTVDDTEVQVTAEALYVQRLEYGFSDGEFELPAELFPARMVASTMGINQPIQMGWGMARETSVTLEHVVPFELVDRVTKMEWRLPLLEKGPRTSEIPFTVSVYRWSDQTWARQEYGLPSLVVYPTDGFLSPDGRVRIRLEKLNDDPVIFGPPGLALSGKGAPE